MSEKMYSIPFRSLMNWILAEREKTGEVFGVHKRWIADPAKQDALRDECADVLLYLLLIADRAGIDLEAAALDKLRKNAEKYPVEKSYGTSRKYTELDG